MAQRFLVSVSTAVLAIVFTGMFTSEAAPAFKFKNSFSTFNNDRFAVPPVKAERRLIAGASPIHYITPFMGMPQSGNTFSNFFAHQSHMGNLGNPASSSIYKLPLKLFSNGKPHAVFHGFPKAQNVMDYLPHAVSKIIRLPLKYLSNAKPVGVYFKDPTFNYL